MLERLPVLIDVIQFSKGKRKVCGIYKLEDFCRLTDLLETSDGSVEFEVKFWIDSDRNTVMDGVIRTTVICICQRCMEPYALPIRTTFMLGAIDSDAKIDQLPSQYEPMLLDDSGSIALRDVIEDELILAMPNIAKHEYACVDTNTVDTQPKTNPFAVLQALKNHQVEHS